MKSMVWISIVSMSMVWKRVATLAVVAVAVAVFGGIGRGGVAAAEQVPKASDGAAPSVHGSVDVAGGEVVPGEFVVTLRPVMGASSNTGFDGGELSARIDEVLSKLNTRTGRAHGHADGSGREPVIAELPIINGFGARLTQAEAAALAGFDDVMSVERNVRVSVSDKFPEPSGLSWGLDRIDQAKLPLDGSYTPPGTGAGVTAYVIDSGVWSKHREFAGRVVEPMIDFVGDVAAPDRVQKSCMGHGTHVAGTIAGTNVGVAPKARVQAVRVIGCERTGTLLAILRGMDWVAGHARLPAVANMSLGVDERVPSMESALRYMTAKGITVVVAAGNDSTDACRQSPAYAPTAITVGASLRNDQVAGFSNTGPCVDIFAPGYDVLSASVRGPDLYDLKDGTSMASPHVAGTAALYLSAHPTATPAAVERAIVGAGAKVMRRVPPGTTDVLVQVDNLADPVNRPGLLPVAHITPPTGVGPIRVNAKFTVDGRASFDPTGGRLDYEWRVQGVDGVAGTNPTLTTVATERGYFEVTLKVTNSSGVSATAVFGLDIAPLPPPVAVIRPATETIYARRGQQLSWDASDSYDPNGQQLYFEWEYHGKGDPIGSSDPTFTTTFDGDDAWLLLTVFNSELEMDAKFVDIVELPTAVISPQTIDVEVGESATFDGSKSIATSGDFLTYEWRDSRAGEVMSSDQKYTRQFNTTGTFEVFLTVINPLFERHTAVARVRVSEGPTASRSSTLPPPLSAAEPHRVLDTRMRSLGGFDRTGPVAAGEVLRISVDDVPDGAVGVVLNVTAVNPTDDGHLTVYPCGVRPNTSNVNYRAGVTSANAVVSSFGEKQDLCVWSLAATDVVVDVTGYVPAQRDVHSAAVRAIDTRSTLGDGFGRLPAGGVVRVPLSSVSQVPKDAGAVFVNLTAANPAVDGHLTVYPCGQVPETSNVNYRAGVTKANMAVVALAKDGSLCVKSDAESDVVVDVLGWVDAGDGVTLSSRRMLDTRAAVLSTSPHPQGKVAAGAIVKVKLDIDPNTVDGVFLNVAAVNPSGDGHLTVFPCGKEPTASVLNYRVGVTTSNMVFSKVDNTGTVCVSTFATTDLIVDHNGSANRQN